MSLSSMSASNTGTSRILRGKRSNAKKNNVISSSETTAKTNHKSSIKITASQPAGIFLQEKQICQLEKKLKMRSFKDQKPQ
jgi:hypothetical protein